MPVAVDVLIASEPVVMDAQAMPTVSNLLAEAKPAVELLREESTRLESEQLQLLGYLSLPKKRINL